MSDENLDVVVEHNRPAAAMWSAGGDHYDAISFGIADALRHAVQRLSARQGEEVLDVATGTGWTARLVARSGARVTGVDIAPGLLAAARHRSAHAMPRIEYQLADAERLPFAAGRFDRVISTFGVMFASDHGRAARELARVCRSGGRLCLATWTPDGAIARFFALLASHRPEPPPAASPLLWGDPDYVEGLLGREFALRFEHGVSNAYYDSADELWDTFVRGFGPLRVLHERLDETGRRRLKANVDAYHEEYRTPAGLHIRREYLLTVGERR
ncbi:MAG TPA: methyltransferase domain-containing protein [Woeseiaceae bacterium]